MPNLALPNRLLFNSVRALIARTGGPVMGQPIEIMRLEFSASDLRIVAARTRDEVWVRRLQGGDASQLTAVVQEFSGKNLWEVFFLAVSFDTSSAEIPVRRTPPPWPRRRPRRIRRRCQSAQRLPAGAGRANPTAGARRAAVASTRVAGLALTRSGTLALDQDRARTAIRVG